MERDPERESTSSTSGAAGEPLEPRKGGEPEWRAKMAGMGPGAVYLSVGLKDAEPCLIAHFEGEVISPEAVVAAICAGAGVRIHPDELQKQQVGSGAGASEAGDTLKTSLAITKGRLHDATNCVKYSRAQAFIRGSDGGASSNVMSMAILDTMDLVARLTKAVAELQQAVDIEARGGKPFLRPTTPAWVISAGWVMRGPDSPLRQRAREMKGVFITVIRPAMEHRLYRDSFDREYFTMVANYPGRHRSDQISMSHVADYMYGIIGLEGTFKYVPGRKDGKDDVMCSYMEWIAPFDEVCYLRHPQKMALMHHIVLADGISADGKPLTDEEKAFSLEKASPFFDEEACKQRLPREDAILGQGFYLRFLDHEMYSHLHPRYGLGAGSEDDED